MKMCKKCGRKVRLLVDRILVNGEKTNVEHGLEDMFMEIETPNMVGK